MIDTHCHLTFADLQHSGSPEAENTPGVPGGIDGVLARASAAGVTGCITISTTVPDAARALAVAHRYPNVWSAAGVHPLYAAEGPHDWAELRRIASDPRCVAWGELGLDNHYAEPPAALQRTVLAEILSVIQQARREGLDKPVVIHCREAFADLIPRLKDSGIPADRFVFHCFTGTPDEARAVLDFGAYLSFTGVVTYKNAGGVREAAKLVPASRLMVETDAPFLSPEPKRSARPCEPWMTSLTAKFLAELRGTPFPDFCRVLDDTTEAFFRVRAPGVSA